MVYFNKLRKHWLAVVGSRDFTNYKFLSNVLDKYLQQKNISCDDLVIVSGGAKGADSLAEHYAITHNIDFVCYPADWDRFGKSAGYKRNVKIVRVSQAVIAFWDGQSKGTEHTINLARENGIPTYHFWRD